MRMKLSYVSILFIVAFATSGIKSQSVTDNLIDDGVQPIWTRNNNLLDDFVQQLIDDFGKVQHATNANSIPQVKERSGSLGFSGITGDVNQRIENVRTEIKELIPVARQSVAEEIAQSNRDKVLLALVNFLGATFGVLLNSVDTDGSLTNFMSLPESNQILILAQLMYGYGYVGPFALEYEDAMPTCGIFEYEQVEFEYSFIDNPTVAPAVLKYFTTEAASGYKKALYCITSRKGSNGEAKKLDALIDLQAELQREKLDN